jgi:hypothetical protein
MKGEQSFLRGKSYLATTLSYVVPSVVAGQRGKSVDAV